MNKRKRRIAIVGFGIALFSLVSVGVASWVIVGGITSRSSSVLVNVDEIHDYRLNIKNLTVSDSNLWFDAEPGDNEGQIRYESNSNTEIASTETPDLTFAISYELQCSDQENYSLADLLGENGVTAYMSLDLSTTNSADFKWDESLVQLPLPLSNNGTDYTPTNLLKYDSASALVTPYEAYTQPSDVIKYQTSVDAAYIKGTQITDGDYSKATSLTLTHTFSFAWGSTFGYTNPSDDSWSELPEDTDVYDVLVQLREYDGIKFTVHLNASTKYD